MRPEGFREGHRFDSDILHKTWSETVRFFLFMAAFVYIIYSERINKYYVGHTEDLQERLIQKKSTYRGKTSKCFFLQTTFRKKSYPVQICGRTALMNSGLQ